MPRERGVIVYEGPSLLTGAPIVAILTGLARGSTNRKTGGMLQLWILRQNTDPITANRRGLDDAICGKCPHRGVAHDGPTGYAKERSCYVLLANAPLSIWKRYQRGQYRRAEALELEALTAGRAVRLGAYGDPAALPRSVLETLTRKASKWTGYTHQWREGFALADLVMASADSDRDVRDAAVMGYRSFHVLAADRPRPPGYMHCPASHERGNRRTCDACASCSGSAKGRPTAHVQIVAHGTARTHALRVLNNST